MESFANALRNMPAIIAENGGYDSAQLVSELRALHKKGNKTAGLGKLRLLKVINIKVLFIISYYNYKLKVPNLPLQWLVFCITHLVTTLPYWRTQRL